MSKYESGFTPILNRAIKRKGGKQALVSLLKTQEKTTKLESKPDAFYLANMCRVVFNAGFTWKVVTQKWPGFEQAFLNFEPNLLLRLSDEQWEGFVKNAAIIRHYTKIKSVRENAQFVHDISLEHGSFGAFLAAWPSDKQIDLMKLLKRRGSRLGGRSGQYFLRFCGWDAFVLSRDVVTCLQGAGLDIASTPMAQRDLKKIQDAFNQWHLESGYSYQHLSQIMAFSVGENVR